MQPYKWHIIIHWNVPFRFGHGITVPLIKDQTWNINETDMFFYSCYVKSIKASYCLSVIISSFVEEFKFGFKRGVGCIDAIYLKHFAMKAVQYL